CTIGGGGRLTSWRRVSRQHWTNSAKEASSKTHLMSQQAQPQALTVKAETVSFTLRELLAYFLRLGTFGFGGPIALAGYMQRDLVDERRWISRQDYLEGLALAQLAPGPLAAQLAIYLGWVRARNLGATDRKSVV